MASKLEILSQVMLSLKVDQSKSMHNINALLNNAGTELDVVDKVKGELGILSSVHAKMEECESFMLQIAQATMKPAVKNVDGIGSDGDAENNTSKHSEK